MIAAAPGRRPGCRRSCCTSAGARPGDLVGLPLDGGTHLVVGEVTGPRREARTDGGDVEHRRDVRWYGELPRSAVHPSAQLQDPRSFFLVHLAEGAEEAEGAGADGVRASRLLSGG